MWTTLLDKLLAHIVRAGTLRLTLPDGTTRTYGSGAPELALTVRDPALAARVIVNPSLAVGEAYMNEGIEIENDDLRAFFRFMIPNINAAGSPWFQRPLDATRQLVRRFRQFAPVGKAQANVAHHYDLSRELYDLFLDEDRQYSCAYFARDGMTLEEAQAAKKHHIARKLQIEPGMRVLDIGCGWGGMGLTLARDYGAEVVGVTLSKEQHALAMGRVRAAGLEGKVDFRLTDYRNVTETFDRIVSVGMFEHVGVPHYNEYFSFVNNALKEDGLALIHTIGHVGPANEADSWITKYIFPGGYTPALSEMQKAIDKQCLVTCDVEALRIHYAKTLGAWHDRFMAHVDKARMLYDERFVRMWRWYLLSMEASFSVGTLLVYQVQLGKQLDAAPITRDYLYEAEMVRAEAAQ
ncbi:SAM-dependent methyltransferase [Sinisalibacter aestuarii]|uniref:Cyclopropane-fatty-acyl-phospholipid synthase n=1 Tax=Sinisalibacter aestuarii TaxID=2949426 RepID=A0ABQ5LPH3_9RHOB|nr:cyclopropane-fatty-acyl-phospholipid synthase family protein [Sinisalibacter aestuarii]GKY86897.1 cyclopropane-fatty-acyl-phospholipid synthase [Sinisalibacter aestuarii]